MCSFARRSQKFEKKYFEFSIYALSRMVRVIIYPPAIYTQIEKKNNNFLFSWQSREFLHTLQFTYTTYTIDTIVKVLLRSAIRQSENLSVPQNQFVLGHVKSRGFSAHPIKYYLFHFCTMYIHKLLYVCLSCT